MTTKTTTYIEGVGRRKEAVARVRLVAGSKIIITANGQPADTYFKLPSLLEVIHRPLEVGKPTESYAVSIKTEGGGIAAQAEAAALGLARALSKADSSLRPALKKAGLLSVDARQKERRKFGLKKARKAPQWSKR